MANKKGVELPNLRPVRKSLGWTQKRLAEEAGVEISTIWRIEKGHSGAGGSTLAVLCSLLNVSPQALQKNMH